MGGSTLFIEARPTIDINFCQFIRKYVALHTSPPKPTEHIASFYFNRKLVFLSCKTFSIDERLIWTQSMWFAKMAAFITTSRQNNYKSLANIFWFPVPHFETQRKTNEITLALLLLDRLAFIDAMAFETFTLILSDILNLDLDENFML